MKRLVFACAVASLIAGGQMYSQGGNPFIDHSDTGETIHVLPGRAAAAGDGRFSSQLRLW
jgi:hypothetical protein